MLIDVPSSFYSQSTFRHCFRNGWIPAYKGISCLSRSIWRSYCCTANCCYRLNFTSAISIKGQGVQLIPLCLYSHISCWHKGWNLLIPTNEDTTILCRIRRLRDCSIIILSYWIYRTAAISVEGYGILVYLPLSLNSKAPCRHRSWYLLIPTNEGVADLSWISRSGNRRAIFLTYWCDCRTIVSIEGNGIFTNFPQCLNSHIFCWHKGRNFFIPA